MSWQDFTANELAVGAPITQELLQKMDDRDKSLCESVAFYFWESQSLDITVNRLWGRVWVPRSASWLHVQCTSGKSGGAGTDPRMRLYATDGSTTSYGDYALLRDVEAPTRVLFPVIPIPAALRNKVVDLYADAEDAPSSVLQFAIANDPANPSTNHGAGAWFTGARDVDPTLYEITAPGAGTPGGGGGGSFSKTFAASATSGPQTWAITGAEHMLGTADLTFEYYKRGGGLRRAGQQPDRVDVNETTFDVAIVWSRPTAGRVVIKA